MDSLGQFIRDRLRAEGYDGLCNPVLECGCPLDDLFACGEPEINDCQPAHFRNRIDSCSCTAESGPAPCLCTRRLEWWEKRGFSQDLIVYLPCDRLGTGLWAKPGFYFVDENSDDLIGPYPTPNAVKADLLEYRDIYLGG
jgi:hypothetical protein